MQQTLPQVFENRCIASSVQGISTRTQDLTSARLAPLVGAGAVLMAVRHAIWIFAFIPACFHPNYDHPTCGPNGECPSGLTCSTQRICEAGANAIIDAGTDSSDIPPPDALVCYGTGIVKVCFASAATQPLTIGDQTLDTGVPAMCATTVSGGDNYCVVVATTIGINGTLRATGTKPLVLIASDSIALTGSGLIDASSRRARANGAPETGAGADATTTICAAGTPPTNLDRGGGAGGTFTGTGGTGGTGVGGSGGTSGSAATPPINTLRGGCPGQDGQGTTGSGSHGGGAVYLIAGNKIDIAGNGILAGGEAGGGGALGPAGGGGGGGGGAGGMIGLDAPLVTLTGVAALVANGGGGGEGGSSTGATGGADGADASTTSTAPGGKGNTGSGGDGGNGSAGAAAGPGAQGLPGAPLMGTNGGGGGGGGGAGIIKAPAGTNFGNKASPAAS